LTSQNMGPSTAHYSQQPQQNLATKHVVAPGQESRQTPSVTSAPPSPASRAGASPMPMLPSMSTALTTQDSYIISPQEQSRYEDLFPNYAQDGYIYGKEAVELFTRSGVPQDNLKKIWNMVDMPVDNRLDKMEFALAMHLIVCISKKGLPLPHSLPVSLKHLKSQQRNPTESQVMLPSTIDGSAETIPLPQSQDIPPSAHNIQGLPVRAEEYSVPQGYDNQRSNAMSITDAFEGLSAATASHEYEEPILEESAILPSYQEAIHSTAKPQDAGSTFSPPVDESVFERPPQTISEPVCLNHAPAPVPTATPGPVTVFVQAPTSNASPKPTEQLEGSYNTGNDMRELDSLKATLQKLRAENISLKAKMGSMSEEEREVKKETIATIEEISCLSIELADLRSQVLTAKLRLMELTAEFTVAKEKKSALSHLITETRESHHTLQTVGNDIQSMNEQLQASSAPSPLHPVAEADLFGAWHNPTSMPAPVNRAPALLVKQNSAETIPIQNGAPPVSDVAPPGQGMVPPIPGTTKLVPGLALPIPDTVPPVPDIAPLVPGMAPPVQNGDAPIPGMSHLAPMETHVDPWGAPTPTLEHRNGNIVHPSVVETASDENIFGAAPLGSDTSSLPPNYQPTSEITTQQYQQHFSDPNESVMGGGPAPQLSLQQTSFGNSGVDRNNVEDLKQSAIQSQQTSQEADETFRTLASEVEKLRFMAESAEADAMAKHEKASKKRGLGRKKATKEAEQAAMDAAEKKKLYLELQAQATDAQALAMESKRQTEKLRDEAEQAELTYVSVQSTKEAQPYQNHSGQLSNSMNSDQSNSEGVPDPSQMPSYSNYGYDSRQQPPIYANGYGNGDVQKPQLEQGNSFGFGAGIMGGGGAPIPAPQSSDAYANPF